MSGREEEILIYFIWPHLTTKHIHAKFAVTSTNAEEGWGGKRGKRRSTNLTSGKSQVKGVIKFSAVLTIFISTLSSLTS